MASARQWFMGARPQTLPVCLSSALAATAVAAYADSISWLHAVLSFITILGVQVGANYANDYFDGIKGTDAVRVGPTRLVASRAATPEQVRAAALVALLVATVAGSVVAATTDPWLFLLGGVCLVAAWTYTGGPRPYAYHGLGEAMVFLFFGPIAVVGTTYVQTETLDGIWIPAFAAGTGVGILTAAVMLANNLRDIETDTAAGKGTMVVAIGARASRVVYVGFLLVALGCLAVLVLSTSAWALLGLAAVVPAVPALRLVLGAASGRRLGPLLPMTSIAELLWALGAFVGLTFLV